ncbi:PAS domain S-box-containing protein [Sphingomonas naasensis]|uniref:histidine kinase n=1 Tax=Sphingomonas naasensis TaxID=1344951 RepID=A0A4S1WRC5_9SPHN|nr:CHASE3 domain-containing protein [Sphingomonas naasensis]NIJ18674.1 PAS domain S-box-containing protein [Sphingomonas naasensis]TGX45914.1 PAS domain S-box protein [Sphingomonas naasensis]
MSLIRATRRVELSRWAVIAAVVGVPLLLLVLTLLVGRGFEETATLRREVVRSYEVRGDLQRILSLHQDLETGQRGFLITGDARFLQPWRDAVRRIDPAFAALERHLPADAAYRPQLAALREVSRDKRSFVERAITLGGADGRAAAHLVAEGEGKRLMDRIRALIGDIEGVERSQLDRATAHFESARIELRNETFALETLLLLFLAAAAFLAAKSNAARNRARRRSEDLATRQEAIFASAKDGMIVLNGSGSVESLNSAAARMFGYAPEDLLRRDIGILFEVAPDRGQIESFLRRLQANRNGSAGEVQEFVGRRRDGAVFPLEVSLSPVPLAETTLFLAVCRDISERREIEQIKGEFVATVSHELRTPLTSIAGSLGLITGGAVGAIPEKALRLIQIAQSNSARLVRLINDILDIEKIEAGRMTFDIKPITLDHILRRAVRDNAGFAAEYGAQVELEPIPAGATVLADEDRLTQVVTNLLSNAVKFSPIGGTVRLRVTALDRRFRISIADEGEGIPEAFRDRIFGKFAQADNTDTRAKGGTGLGLSIVREIVARLGGSVTFDSAVGQGATFHVDLPAATIVREPAAPAAARDRTGLPGILHLDDDPDMLRVLSSLFENRAEIYSTPSVVEACAAIRHRRFDGAILDIGLADGSGLEVVPLLRRQRAEMPIVVFTAQEVDPAEIADVDLVLVKSRASLDHLVEEVIRMIATRREEQAR